jgi:hypothetical protein
VPRNRPISSREFDAPTWVINTTVGAALQNVASKRAKDQSEEPALHTDCGPSRLHRARPQPPGGCQVHNGSPIKLFRAIHGGCVVLPLWFASDPLFRHRTRLFVGGLMPLHRRDSPTSVSRLTVNHAWSDPRWGAPSQTRVATLTRTAPKRLGSGV